MALFQPRLQTPIPPETPETSGGGVQAGLQVATELAKLGVGVLKEQRQAKEEERLGNALKSLDSLEIAKDAFGIEDDPNSAEDEFKAADRLIQQHGTKAKLFVEILRRARINELGSSGRDFVFLNDAYAKTLKAQQDSLLDIITETAQKQEDAVFQSQKPIVDAVNTIWGVKITTPDGLKAFAKNNPKKLSAAVAVAGARIAATAGDNATTLVVGDQFYTDPQSSTLLASYKEQLIDLRLKALDATDPEEKNNYLLQMESVAAEYNQAVTKMGKLTGRNQEEIETAKALIKPFFDAGKRTIDETFERADLEAELQKARVELAYADTKRASADELRTTLNVFENLTQNLSEPDKAKAKEAFTGMLIEARGRGSLFELSPGIWKAIDYALHNRPSGLKDPTGYDVASTISLLGLVNEASRVEPPKIGVPLTIASRLSSLTNPSKYDKIDPEYRDQVETFINNTKEEVIDGLSIFISDYLSTHPQHTVIKDKRGRLLFAPKKGVSPAGDEGKVNKRLESFVNYLKLYDMAVGGGQTSSIDSILKQINEQINEN